MAPAVSTAPVPVEIANSTFTLLCTGDVMPAHRLAAVMKEEGVDYPFARLGPVLEGMDVMFFNLEVPVGTTSVPFPKKYNFLMRPAHIQGLTHLRPRLVAGLANNHILDQGPAALAETGLRHRSPLATATLIVGANAPDIDAVAQLLGRDAALYWRRGHTHGVVAMIVLPLVLTGLMLLIDRAVRRRRKPDAPPARAGPLLALAALSVLTHPVLDWMNTYGVRLLMPFDPQWFYGDALFIVDLIAGLRAAGWTIVTMDEAYSDPIAQMEPDTLYLGGGRVTALASAAGRDPETLVHERTDETELARLFEERVVVRAAP